MHTIPTNPISDVTMLVKPPFVSPIMNYKIDLSDYFVLLALSLKL